MTENPSCDPDDYCYKCSGYEEDYCVDEDGELICGCPECPFSEFWEDE